MSLTLIDHFGGFPMSVSLRMITSQRFTSRAHIWENRVYRLKPREESDFIHPRQLVRDTWKLILGTDYRVVLGVKIEFCVPISTRTALHFSARPLQPVGVDSPITSPTAAWTTSGWKVKPAYATDTVWVSGGLDDAEVGEDDEGAADGADVVD